MARTRYSYDPYRPPTPQQFTTTGMSHAGFQTVQNPGAYQSALADWEARQRQEQTQKVEQLETEHRERTQAREQEIRGLYGQITDMFSPGGGFGAGTEAMLGQQRQQYTAAGLQGLVQSGLANTTQAAGLHGRFEQEIGMPTRMKLEDLRYGALSQALGQQASFIERIEDRIPDYGTIAGLTSIG